MAAAFRHTPADAILGFDNPSHAGVYATYPAGSYVARPPHAQEAAAEYLSALFAAGWVDRHTRALVVDLTVLNVDVGALTAVRLVAELSPVGKTATSFAVQSMLLQPELFRRSDPQSWLELCFVVMVAFYCALELWHVLLFLWHGVLCVKELDDEALQREVRRLKAKRDGEVCHYMTQPLVELYGGCMMVLKVS